MPKAGLTKCFAAMILLLCGASAFALGPLTDAVNRLSQVGEFAFGGVGMAGQTSKGEIDFRLILSQPTPVALAALEKLYVSGNPQAKSYALFGMWKKKPGRFKELLVSAEASTAKVDVMRGCIITHESLRDVAVQIDKGDWDVWFKNSH